MQLSHNTGYSFSVRSQPQRTDAVSEESEIVDTTKWRRHKGCRGRNTVAMGQSGPGRDHKLAHPTMCVSFLAVKGGSSISEAEAAGIASSGGRKPLLSIRLGGMGPHNVTQQLVIILL